MTPTGMREAFQVRVRASVRIRLVGVCDRSKAARREMGYRARVRAADISDGSDTAHREIDRAMLVSLWTTSFVSILTQPSE